MVLLAVVCVMRADRAEGRVDTYQRLRVHEAVTRLQGCLTCHAVTPSGPVSYRRAAPETVTHTDIHLPEAGATVSPLKTQVNSRLLEVGQRIEALPQPRDVLVRTVTHDFLEVYDRVNPVTEPMALVQVFHALDGLERLLRQAENQAHSEKMDTFSPRSSRDTQAAIQSNPAAPRCCAVAQAAIELIVNMGTTPVAHDTQDFIPVVFAFVVNRRGPPASNAVESHSVWTGRLPLSVVQSSFCSCENSTPVPEPPGAGVFNYSFWHVQL